MSDILIKLGIPCFIAFLLAMGAIMNWELERESRMTEHGLSIAANDVMLIFMLIISLFVSLTLIATAMLAGYLGYRLNISTIGLVIIEILTGSLSAFLLLLRDIIDMTLFIGESKGSGSMRLIGAFVPPVAIPILIVIISNMYAF